jgi:hypothetical protein
VRGATVDTISLSSTIEVADISWNTFSMVVARGVLAPARRTWPVAPSPFPPSIASTGYVSWRGKLAEVVWGCNPQYPQDREWAEPPVEAQPTRKRRMELGADRHVLQGGTHILGDQVESDRICRIL